MAEYGPFGIIVDDGSHVPKHVVETFHILWPTMADGGIYVIEDTQTSFWAGWGGSLEDGGQTFNLARAGYANLISVYTMGKDFDAALKISKESLARWPDHPFLIAATAGVYAAVGNTAQSEKLREKLK